ncbi:hypothetical protein [Phreatobacter sp.]|uniref:hypothetical protein n=1 Tax=Phreatobacter sp. TaxID=1966341 RepID=UPI003F722918
MRLIDRRAAFGAMLPLLASLFAVVWAYATGLTARGIDEAVDSPWLILGVYADRFPVFAFAIVFVLVRLLVGVFVARRPMILFRLVLFVPAVALVLVATLYPTFGGIVARGAFMGGGFSLINSVVAGAGPGTLLGGAVAGATLALLAGLARAIFDWSWGWTLGKPIRAILALAAWAAMGAILAWGWSVLASAGAQFPRAPLTLVEMLGLLVLLIVATIPQMLVAAIGDKAKRPVAAAA